MKPAFDLLALALPALAGCAAAPSPAPPAVSLPAARQSASAQPASGPAVRAGSTAPLAHNEAQAARYTTVTTLPTEADANPLAVLAQVHFPRSVVSTVGDAVRHVLVRTGYRLVPEDRLDARVKAVLALRLPDNQRVLGPYRVDTMLGVLLGEPFRLVTDPASRTVSYLAPATESDRVAAARGSARAGVPAARSLDANVLDKAGIADEQRRAR